ncbi:hypothetical protein TI05_01400 [Achromatium sp. WMS3]|nr:hypothetical protein TI05_01400 [Achromatium sp. WMS3]
MLFSLQQHPITSIPQISVKAEIYINETSIDLSYTVRGDIDSLYIPETKRHNRRTDNLWKHTCADFFIEKEKVGTGYWEWNFALSKQWQLYGFGEYRKRRTKPKVAEPDIYKTRRSDSLFLQIYIPKLSKTTIPRMGLNMILEDKQQQLSYWGIKHVAGPPDFHNASTWTKL